MGNKSAKCACGKRAKFVGTLYEDFEIYMCGNCGKLSKVQKETAMRKERVIDAHIQKMRERLKKRGEKT